MLVAGLKEVAVGRGPASRAHAVSFAGRTAPLSLHELAIEEKSDVRLVLVGSRGDPALTTGSGGLDRLPEPVLHLEVRAAKDGSPPELLPPEVTLPALTLTAPTGDFELTIVRETEGTKPKSTTTETLKGKGPERINLTPGESLTLDLVTRELEMSPFQVRGLEFSRNIGMAETRGPAIVRGSVRFGDAGAPRAPIQLEHEHLRLAAGDQLRASVQYQAGRLMVRLSGSVHEMIVGTESPAVSLMPERYRGWGFDSLGEFYALLGAILAPAAGGLFMTVWRWPDRTGA